MVCGSGLTTSREPGWKDVGIARLFSYAEEARDFGRAQKQQLLLGLPQAQQAQQAHFSGFHSSIDRISPRPWGLLDMKPTRLEGPIPTGLVEAEGFCSYSSISSWLQAADPRSRECATSFMSVATSLKGSRFATRDVHLDITMA